jgi:zinc finger protein
VLKSNSCFLKIPELGVEVKPGPASQSYLTNIEGVLLRIEEAALTLQGDSQTEQRRNHFLSRLREAKEGRLPFTLILKDPRGNSAIVSNKPGKVESRILTEKEIEELEKMLVGFTFGGR